MKDMTRKGFTLVEIMIVVAIIGVLAAIAIPNFVKSRKTAQKNACIANLKQIQGGIEQALMNGEAIDQWKTYVKDGDKLKCPTTQTAYATPAVDSDPACPSSIDGHTLDKAKTNP
ncbi:MAG: type II secretion system protein [Kiritimatiellia bacterium]